MRLAFFQFCQVNYIIETVWKWTGDVTEEWARLLEASHHEKFTQLDRRAIWLIIPFLTSRTAITMSSKLSSYFNI